MTFEAAVVVVGVVVKPGRRQDRRGARRGAQVFPRRRLGIVSSPAPPGRHRTSRSASFHPLPPRCVGAPSSKRYPNSDVNARHRSATCSLEYSV